DPKNASLLVNLAYSYIALRNFEAAQNVINRLAAIAPDSFETLVLKAYVALESKGDLEPTEKQFASLPIDVDPNGVLTWAKSGLLMWQRKFPEALAVVQK